jgi:hypothetical protein
MRMRDRHRPVSSATRRARACSWAIVGVLGVAACSSSASPERTTSTPTQHVTSFARVLPCAQLAGAAVPVAIAAVTCDAGTGRSHVSETEESCAGGGTFFWVTAQLADGTQLAPLVGKPGGTWRAGKVGDGLAQLKPLIGC